MKKSPKPYLLFFALFLGGFYGVACDTEHYNFPIDNQLYARDTISNYADIDFFGVDTASCADSIGLFIFRDSILIDSVFVGFSSDTAFVSYGILAELAYYDLRLYNYSSGAKASIDSAFNIVAGDVYVVDGQSNAEARGWTWWDTIPSFEESPFIRVFASGQQDATVANDLHWYQGIAMADRNTSGNLGGLAARLARSIVDNQQIPVAIFNGAHGGTPMSFHVPDSANHENLNTNYGRLLYRLRQARLEDKVKGIVWYQGESDTWTSSLIKVSKEDYVSMYLEMYDGWKLDFPSFEQIYLIQIRAGCGRPALNVLEIQEAHRILASTKDEIQIISTKGIPMGLDHCHYYYLNGYQAIAERIYELVDRDFYNSATNLNIDAPFVLSARMNSPTEVVLTMENVSDTYILDVGIEPYFYLGDTAISVLSASIVNQEIVLNLSSAIAAGEVLSLLDTYGAGILSPYLRNTNDIGAVSFKEMPICGNLDITATIDDETCPGLNDGQILLSTVGMTGPVTYTWSTGASGNLLSNLAPGNYEVLAMDSIGCALRKSFTVGAAPPPAAVNLNLISSAGTSIILNWNWVSGNNNYYLQYRMLGDINWNSYTTSGSTAIVNGLTACTDYEFRIGGDCSADSISHFNPIVVYSTIDCFVCTSPQNLFQFNIQNISAIITWDVLVGATNYTYKFRELGDQNWISETTTFPIAILFGISSCKDYEWTLETTCYDGSTAQSGVVNTFSTQCKHGSDNDNTLNAQENFYIDDIILFPNPADKYLNVISLDGFEKNKVQILNAKGNMIWQNIDLDQGKRFAIDVSEWPSGIYYIRVGSKLESFVKI